MSMREAVRASNRIRVLRVAMAPFLARHLALAALDSAAGRYLLVLVNVACALTLVGVVALQTCLIGRIEKRRGARGSLPEAALRRVASRPRTTMTPEDYEHLRELEAELGWEPSEPCMPVKVPEPMVPGTSFAAFSERMGDFQKAIALAAAGSISFSSGTGKPAARECRLCGDDIASVQARIPESAEPLRSCCLECAQEIRREDIRQKRAAAKPQAPSYALARTDREIADVRAVMHFEALARVGLEHCISPCRMCAERS